jgi:hypothetical protein
MKVLIANDGKHAHYYIRKAIGSVLAFMGHDVRLWEIGQKPTFDAFDEMEPDLFIGQSYNLTPAIHKCIAERPNMRVIMKGSDWGPNSDVIDRERFPVLIANEQEIDRIKKLKEETGKPDFLYVHYMDKRLDQTHGHWREAGIQVESLMNAADIFEFTNGVSRPEYECDIGFLGGCWGYKNITLSKYINPLCELDNGLNVKIFGNGWGVPQHCGYLAEGEEKHFLASAKVCPNVSEPHSQEFGYDVIERPFKLLSNKRFVVTDFVEDLYELFPDGMIHCETPAEFEKVIRDYLGRPNDRKNAVETGYEAVMGGHTYFHRVAAILLNLGLEEESVNCMLKFAEAKERLKL